MEVVQYKCPNCGADLPFNAATQGFDCKYCDSNFTSEQMGEIYPSKETHALDTAEPPKTAEELEQDKLFAEYNALYNCPSCGAAVVTENTTSATTCFYCHSPVILTGRLSGEYKPAKLIPFQIIKSGAEQKLQEYCKKRWFLPKGFKSGATIKDMTAIYVPYWISDCTAGGRITANCKKLRKWRSGDYMYTETKEYIAVRDGDMRFDKIPHDASTRACDTLMECIEPFNYSEITDFKMSYLSGYIAEKYDVTQEQVYPRVKERAVNGATKVLKDSITGYNSVSITQNTIDILKNKWSHYLLPVWFLSYTYQGKDYHFAVNGQTGKFAGNLPIVWKKVILTLGIGLAVIDLLIALFLLFLY
ncbi:MAG: hypothetical protein FWD34_10090 [Oscillospiraceae bacterium]|nr:hypothetical protein [Oscillospiraceae bacterium]